MFYLADGQQMSRRTGHPPHLFSSLGSRLPVAPRGGVGAEPAAAGEAYPALPPFLLPAGATLSPDRRSRGRPAGAAGEGPRPTDHWPGVGRPPSLVATPRLSLFPGVLGHLLRWLPAALLTGLAALFRGWRHPFLVAPAAPRPHV